MSTDASGPSLPTEEQLKACEASAPFMVAAYRKLYALADIPGQYQRAKQLDGTTQLAKDLWYTLSSGISAYASIHALTLRAANLGVIEKGKEQKKVELADQLIDIINEKPTEEQGGENGSPGRPIPWPEFFETQYDKMKELVQVAGFRTK